MRLIFHPPRADLLQMDPVLAIKVHWEWLQVPAAPPRPPPLRTKWARRVPHPVLIGHAASLTPYWGWLSSSLSLHPPGESRLLDPPQPNGCGRRCCAGCAGVRTRLSGPGGRLISWGAPHPFGRRACSGRRCPRRATGVPTPTAPPTAPPTAASIAPPKPLPGGPIALLEEDHVVTPVPSPPSLPYLSPYRSPYCMP